MSKDRSEFVWAPQPEGQQMITALVEAFLSRCVFARELAQAMRDRTGTRFGDWVDHIEVARSEALVAPIREVGFERQGMTTFGELWVHPGAVFPKILLRADPSPALHVGIRVERLEDFCGAHGIGERSADIVGGEAAPMRLGTAACEQDAELRIVERNGSSGFELHNELPDNWALHCEQALDRFRSRPRGGVPEDVAFGDLRNRLDDAAARIGHGPACELFFRAEREYWMSRNTAGRVQYERQGALGLGWANHDHHTFRSSRTRFSEAVRVFESLGLYCREAFHAGAEAGWGAQVLESPETGIVVFCDVDMSPDEIDRDFAHDGLAARGDLGTVGLWVALHGESLMQSGMHHLEAQFDWHALRDQLASSHEIRCMEPFTTFPYLRQAFTEGERWRVDPVRLAPLIESGQITPEQGEEFRESGALGSHLENLERNDGFKGFNQTGVSDIIRRTDPRLAV